jgi:integrase
MPTTSQRQPASERPHLWRHPNGRYYLKWADRRASTGTKDLEAAKGKLKEYISSIAEAPCPQRSKGIPTEKPHLWKHSKNGVFYILYRDENGNRRTRKTTGTKVPEEAQAIFDCYLAELAKPKLPKVITVRDILQGYLEDHGPTVASPDSLRHSVNALLPTLGNLYPSLLSDAQLRLFAKARQAQGRKDGTIARDVQILRAALKWAARQAPRWLDTIPAFRMPVKASPPRDRWLTRDEASRLLDCCEARHIRLFVLLALHTTKRTGAILGLKWRDIRDGMICFGSGTGNKRRGDVPMNSTLSEALADAYPFATTDWIIEYGGSRVLSVKNGFKAACGRAGIEGATPHVLRHTSATWMAMAGVPMAEIARVLGNSEAICEKVYAKYHPDYLRRAVAAIEAA